MSRSHGPIWKDLCEDADKDNSGTISAEEFLKALTTGKVAFNYLKESLNKGANEMKQTAEKTRRIFKGRFLFQKKRHEPKRNASHFLVFTL